MSGIHLKSIEYSEFTDRPLAWSISGLSFGQINLLVGKNASGKTRTVNLVGNLAKMLLQSDRLTVSESDYRVRFDNNGTEIEYVLTVRDKTVQKEQVIVDGETRLDRNGNKMTIYAEELEKDIEFSPPNDEIAAVSRRDKLQHPFLIPLHTWASSVRHYHFGSTLGKDHLVIRVEDGPSFNDSDENQVVAIFENGKKEFGQKYVDAVIDDMVEIGYEIQNIHVETPQNISLSSGTIGGQILAVGIEEEGIKGTIFQNKISQGMFRTLSILAQIQYSQMANKATCIIIDDIGEGLDFDRSGRLIDILRKKSQESDFQLIMTTNDQFVMNHVPLEEWSVLQRDGGQVTVRNAENSREAFEDFKFVGMSNFAFFEMDFANGAPPEEEALANE